MHSKAQALPARPLGNAAAQALAGKAGASKVSSALLRRSSSPRSSPRSQISKSVGVAGQLDARAERLHQRSAQADHGVSPIGLAG